MALRAGRKDPVLQAPSEQELLDVLGWKAEPRAEGVDEQECASVLTLRAEQPTQNWSGQGESDCLIKTKHCDGPSGC
jgi:hypothetical protein